MPIGLNTIVSDFAEGIKAADRKKPKWRNYKPGIGPHTETKTIELVLKELSAKKRNLYTKYKLGASYPEETRKKCDLCLGKEPDWDWAVEIKMWRILGDNNKRNDNMVTHILSPYETQNSAFTDCLKLRNSTIKGNKAILIYGYEHSGWSMDPLIEAFEVLARYKVNLTSKAVASFERLIHPVHSRGRVIGWQIV
jgi:hypothetical protein